MGVNFRDLVVRHPVSFSELSGKTLVVDGHNMLYQFLSTIRARDGSLLTDSRGRVTSHLIGLFSRVINLMQRNIRLAFVFDGSVPVLKRRELSKRAELKKEAQRRFSAALERGDVEGMRKFASRTSRLTGDMVDDAKSLLSALGIPWVQAPSEGEAQAARMVSAGDAWAVASQDYDSLLFGAPRLLQNLSVEGRRKLPGKFAYVRVEPLLIDLDESLSGMGISREKLLWLAVLIGTDYNPAGVRGIGPKKGLALVKKYESAEELFGSVELADDVDWRDVLETFAGVETTGDYVLEWREPDRGAVRRVLVVEHDFSEERVEASLFSVLGRSSSQSSLGDF